jgi:hypothetical protein
MSLTERAVPDGVRAAGGAVFVVIALAVDWALAVVALAGGALLRKGGRHE